MSQIQERNVSFGKSGTIFRKKISKENNLYFNVRSLIFISDILSNGKIIDTDINVNLVLGIFSSPMSKYYKSGMLLNIEDCLNLRRMFNAFKSGQLNEILYKKESKLYKGDAQVTEVVNFGIQKANDNGGFWARIGSFNPHTNEHYDYFDFQIYANDIVRLSNIISSFDQMYNRIYFDISTDLALQELRGSNSIATQSPQTFDNDFNDGFYGNSNFQTSSIYKRSNPQEVQNDPTVKNTDALKQYNQQYDGNCDVSGNVQEPIQPNNGFNLDIDFNNNLPFDEPNINDIQNNVPNINDNIPNINDTVPNDVPNINNVPNINDNIPNDEPNINDNMPNDEPEININNVLNDVNQMMQNNDSTNEHVIKNDIDTGCMNKVQSNNIDEPKPEDINIPKNIDESIPKTVEPNPDDSNTIIHKHDNKQEYQYVYTDAMQNVIQAFSDSIGCEQEKTEYGIRYIMPYFSEPDNSFSVIRQLSNNVGNFGISSYAFDPTLYFIFIAHIQYMHKVMKGAIETNEQINNSNFDFIELKGLYLIFLNWFKLSNRVKGDDVIFTENEIEIGERLITMLESFLNSKEIRNKCYDSVFLQSK